MPRPVRFGRLLLVAALASASIAGAASAAVRPSTPAWSQGKVDLPAASRLARGGAPITVAVVDSGVDAADPALRGALVAGRDFSASAGGETVDPLGHGTAVAAIIAGRTKVYGVTGACSRCRVMPVRVADASGAAQPAALAAGIRWAAAAGARVINVSMLLPGENADVTAAVADAISRGAIVVAGAGNAGTSARGWPAADPGVVSVAATDARDAREPWSNFGSWVDVAAPGCTTTQGAGGSFVRFCGTSSATALVSGVIALALSTRPNATGAEVTAALAATSTPVGPFVRWGRIDARRLVRALAPASGGAR